MHYGLVIIGAHDGEKAREWIDASVSEGMKVLLVEPVPFLFERLISRYATEPNVTCRRVAISNIDGEIDFISPKESANGIVPYGDQLGSFIWGHAAAHDQRLSEFIEVIKVRGETFATLLAASDITSIDVLLTDIEGVDAKLLLTFPFDAIRPRQIMFEFKHSDGFMRVGKTLGELLIKLQSVGYSTRPLDHESFLATMET